MSSFIGILYDKIQFQSHLHIYQLDFTNYITLQSNAF